LQTLDQGWTGAPGTHGLKLALQRFYSPFHPMLYIG
jgi:hypothetical protein